MPDSFFYLRRNSKVWPLQSLPPEGTGFKDFRFHDLRPTWVTNARNASVDRTVIMKLNGHKTLSMFMRYNSVDEADARQALSLTDGYFAGRLRKITAIVL